MKYWTCPKEWPDETAWIVCGGPSGRGVDLSPLKGRRTIAVNRSAFSVPFADFCIFGDRTFYVDFHKQLKTFAGRVVTNSPSVREEGVLVMKKTKPPPGIVDDPDTLPMLWTTTGAAMQLAVHLGARRLVLLFLDGAKASDGRWHHHAEYEHRPAPRANWFAMQNESLSYCVKPLADRGIEVINANPASAFDHFQKRRLDDCLRELP